MGSPFHVRVCRDFDARFFERSPLFWPIADAARALVEPLGAGTDFPPVECLDRVFDRGWSGSGDFAHSPPRDGGAPVRFVAAAPRPSRRTRARTRAPIDPLALYDARITLEKVVPTRPRSWHDLMNALVWGTFPRAKSALHARQHRAIVERIAPGARSLPPSRTRELDALALLDEGGVLLAASPHAFPVVFGHAIYESLALGLAPAVVAAIDLDAHPARSLAALDEALARVIENDSRLRTPDELRRVDLGVQGAGGA